MGRLVALALLLAAVGVTVVVVVGPGKDRPEPRKPAKASSGGRPSPERNGTAGGARGPSAPVGATVRMSDLAFHRATVRVRVGQEVRWINDDDVAHTVQEDLGARSGVFPAFESKRIPPGGSFRFVARAAGRLDYVCTLHPTVMTGRVVVGRRA